MSFYLKILLHTAVLKFMNATIQTKRKRIEYFKQSIVESQYDLSLFNSAKLQGLT